MYDMTLCNSSECECKEDCLRYTLRQTISPGEVFTEFSDCSKSKCRYYIIDDRKKFNSDNPYQD